MACGSLWGEQQQEASFCTLKDCPASRPVLAFYRGEALTEVHTDASKLGIGGILFQVATEGDLRPVSYYCRATISSEQIYHSYELETLAVVE